MAEVNQEECSTYGKHSLVVFLRKRVVATTEVRIKDGERRWFLLMSGSHVPGEAFKPWWKRR
ncbi:hypothetical protein KDA_46850 [Dictyobacter alpinus]|uniref:Uncharacterized protein n=1 Tax=Dictyobacter alpinus TaxID=2014873 RepID=A0A402BCS3_9CHLR|nr:hypothetical protein [Dictyobacter alpinus]GCE29201.1 hypothetical protein KDA_46850 [Dictyobacter alpinus]